MDLSASSNPIQRASWFGGGFGVLWLLFWSAITCAFDGLWLWMMASQFLTWTYDSAEGMVLESRIEKGTDSDGDATYDARIEYEYVVRGKKHRGKTIRDFALRMNGGLQQAQQSVGKYAAGKRVSVYYHPSAPERAVLERGVSGGDFFLPLFMTPFNIVMLGGWYAIAASWRTRGKPAAVNVRDDGLKVAARFYNVRPLAAAVVAVMISSFVMIFVCGFGMMSLPADGLVPAAWCVVFASAAVGYGLFRQPATTLEFDQFSGRIAIAKSDGQAHAFKVEDVIAVGRDEPADEFEEELEEEDVDETDGEAGEPGEEPLADDDQEMEPPPESWPTITYRDAGGQEQTVLLANLTGDDAAWVADWLKETLRLKQ